MSGHLAMQKAFDAAVRDGRALDAARLARSLNRKAEAAAFFSRAGACLEAALIYRECGQASRALNEALLVPPGDATYREAARLAIDLAAALRLVRNDVDEFLAPYLAQTPASREDLDAFFLLGQLYALYEYTNLAFSLYRRVVQVDPSHVASIELARAESLAQGSTAEVLVSAEDVRQLRQMMSLSPAQGKGTSARFPLGTIIAERYRIEEFIGSGSTASVFRAFDLKLEEPVALKAFDSVSRDGHQEARFRREVSLARKLAHPSIVRLHDIVEHEGRRFITMELLCGKDLRSVIDASDVSLATKRDLIVQACEGLGYAHENCVIHRDVKPENLFVTAAHKLKVADFGIAKGFGDASITMTGSMGGTPYYMSPEQITDFRSVDYRTDLYALGCVTYELFTGRVPFHAEGLTQLLMLHLEVQPPPMRELCPELPSELDEIVLSLLQKAPERRPHDCREVAARLATLCL